MGLTCFCVYIHGLPIYIYSVCLVITIIGELSFDQVYYCMLGQNLIHVQSKATLDHCVWFKRS